MKERNLVQDYEKEGVDPAKALGLVTPVFSISELWGGGGLKSNFILVLGRLEVVFFFEILFYIFNVEYM